MGATACSLRRRGAPQAVVNVAQVFPAATGRPEAVRFLVLVVAVFLSSPSFRARPGNVTGVRTCGSNVAVARAGGGTAVPMADRAVETTYRGRPQLETTRRLP